MILCGEEHAKAIDKSVFPFMQGGPLMHVIAAKAVAFLEALQPDFALYSARVIANAKALGEGLAGHGFHLVSGGTDNHLLLVDLRPSHPDLTGKDAETALEAAGITVNKNTVPGESRSPFVTSGLRIGTPALTTRGMGEGQMTQVADWIAEVLGAPGDSARIERVRVHVQDLSEAFPLYAELASAG
jgi:glycine hydroxymethyltransferase